MRIAQLGGRKATTLKRIQALGRNGNMLMHVLAQAVRAQVQVQVQVRAAHLVLLARAVLLAARLQQALHRAVRLAALLARPAVLPQGALVQPM